MSELRYTFLTMEQQLYFNSLNANQQAYIRFRGLGHSKRDAYLQAYPKTKNPNQSCNVLESRNPKIVEIIECFLAHKRNKELYAENSEPSKTIDKIAKLPTIETEMVPLQTDGVEPKNDINGFSVENAQRLSFYRQIANGKIKTTKTRTTYDADGNITGKTVEEIEDVDMRIKARKEIDKILGLAEMIKLGSVKVTPDIKVIIVDSSKKEEYQPNPELEKMKEIQEEVVEEDGDDNK